MISIKSKREIEKMRTVGKLAAETLAMLGDKLRIGMSTDEINALCHDYTLKHNAVPAPLNYHGFPKSLCTSRNEVICHGIPSPNEFLENGDLLNLDVTSILNGYHGDTNRTFFIGEVSQDKKDLVKTTYQCLLLAIQKVGPDAYLGDIGEAIQTHAEARGYSVVRDFCGHGIGRRFHEDPQVFHFGKKGTGPKLREGMTFTIEPMINLGTYHSRVLEDGWTAVTQDGKASAQFEHTLVVTSHGAEILTPWPEKPTFYVEAEKEINLL